MWNQIITKYLENDNSVSEIETNGGTSLFVRKNGKRIEIPNVFHSVEEYKRETDKLIKRINPYAPERPMYLEEGTLFLKNVDGTDSLGRCHIVLPPVSLAPLVTIARKTQDLTTLNNICASGSMTKKMQNFIQAAIDCKLTIALSGSTGSGKTTMLEAMTKYWPNDARIGVVEDAPELMLTQPNVVYLKSSVAKPGQDPNQSASLSWGVAQLNRMRVDLIVVGETRGKEFADFLTAANSGCEGSLTTIHAENPERCLQKMNSFVNEAQSSPQRVINKNISSTIDVIIQLNKTVDGKYRTTQIAEVSRQLSNDESATIATHPIFVYDKETDSWDFHRPSDQLLEKIYSHGYDDSFIKENSFDDVVNKRPGLPKFGFGRR